MRPIEPVRTERLELRCPTEDDRSTFIGLFCSDEFMRFLAGTLSPTSASERFDVIVTTGQRSPSPNSP